MNRNDLRELARVRLQEAEALLAAGHYSGAYYLAGYAVECALKACIAKQTRAGDFPDLEKVRASYSHDLERLVVVAGLKEQLDELVRTDPTFRIYWSHVAKWAPESRYAVTPEEVATALHLAIADPRHGVLRWLRRYS